MIHINILTFVIINVTVIIIFVIIVVVVGIREMLTLKIADTSSRACCVRKCNHCKRGSRLQGSAEFRYVMLFQRPFFFKKFADQYV